MTIGTAFVWHLDSEGLRAYRKAHGLSRPQFGEAVGLHPKTIEAYESRRSTQVTEKTAEKLARVVPHLIAARPSGQVSLLVAEWAGRSSSLTLLWREWLSGRLLTDSTIDTYERSIRRLEVHSGKPRPEITRLDVERYLRDSSLGASIKQQTFIGFRLWHKWGATRGYWALDGEIAEMRFPKTRSGARPALTAPEAANLIAAAETAVEKRLIFLGLFAGLRLAEIVAVNEGSFKGPMLEVPVKGGWRLGIPIHPALLEVRSDILSDQPSRKVVQRTCSKLHRFLGYGITPHWLRRTFAERLVESGVQRDVVGALLGHSPKSVTVDAYAPVTWAEMTASINGLQY